jgi:tetratricopeptide (TPR) repeat protein
MAPTLSVFISHTSELATYPAGGSFVAAAAKAITRATHAVCDMADFAARDQWPAEHCRQRLERCDVYLGIIGFRYGSLVPGTDVSHTEYEFDLATQLGQYRLVFLLDEKAEFHGLDRQDAEVQRQEAFRTKLMGAGLTLVRVDSPSDLEMRAYQGLIEMRDVLVSRELPAGPSVPARSRQAMPIPRVTRRPPAVVPVEIRDRFQDVQLLRKRLEDRTDCVSVLLGSAGTGKTALMSALFRNMETIPSSFVALDYVSARGYMSVSGATMLDSLVRTIPKTATRERLHEDLLTQRVSWLDKIEEVMGAIDEDVLIVLDHVEDLLENDGRFQDRALNRLIEELAARTDHHVSVLLVSSRSPDARLIGRTPRSQIDLDHGLPAEHTAELLDDLTCARPTEPKLDPERVFALTQGHPRCVELVVAVTALKPGLALSDLGLPMGRGTPERITSLLDHILGRLSVAEHEVLVALAVLGLPVPGRAVQSVLDNRVAPDEAMAILGRLADVRVVRRNGSDYYLPADPDAAHIVARWLESSRSADYHTLLGRAADYFAAVALEMEVRRVEDLAANFREISLRLQRDEGSRALELMEDLDNAYLGRWGYMYVLLPWRRKLADRFRGGQYGRANLSAMADAAIGIDEYRAALTYLEEAYQQESDTPGDAGDQELLTLLTQMGSASYFDGRLTAAGGYYQRVLADAQRLSRPLEAAGAHLGLCICMADIGRFEAALEHQQQARSLLRLNEAPGRHLLDAQVEHAGGVVRRCVGEYEAAVRSFQKAARTAAVLGDRRLQAICIDAEAGALLDAAEGEDAVERGERAAQLAAESGVSDLTRRANATLALTYLSRGRLDDARLAATGAARFFRSGRALSGYLVLGIVAFRTDRISASDSAFRTAIDAAKDLLEREPRAYVVRDALGLAYCGLMLTGVDGALANANQAYEQARRITSARGAVRRAAVFLDALAADVNPALVATVRRAAGARPTR